MSWSAHLQHTETGLALTFAEPLSRLDMTADVAAHLASLLAGVVRALEAKSAVICAGHGVHPLCCDCEPCLNGDHHG